MAEKSQVEVALTGIVIISASGHAGNSRADSTSKAPSTVELVVVALWAPGTHIVVELAGVMGGGC
ncbi:hypothetical protein IFM47457_10675 [Aspergillus lentulus]|nr:hypothetical protein IFM47457_10675 [Aspergillus lentulus]